jgi:hypothetical protein
MALELLYDLLLLFSGSFNKKKLHNQDWSVPQYWDTISSCTPDEATESQFNCRILLNPGTESEFMESRTSLTSSAFFLSSKQ